MIKHKTKQGEEAIIASAPNQLKKKPLRVRLAHHKELYVLMLPAILWCICFHILPLYGISMAFVDYKIAKGIFGSEFVGFKNFQILFANPDFLSTLWNTFRISLLKLVFGFPAPILLALSINAVTVKWFRKSVQTISYLPNFISWVVIYGLTTVLFDQYNGVIGNMVQDWGLSYSDPSKTASSFVTYLVATAVWKGIGMGSIIYLAVLSGIDPQLYEAAKVDGASRFKQLLHITIPTILPTCAVVLILNVGSLLSGDFEQIYLFQGNDQELIRVSEIFETWAVKNGIGALKYSIGTALGMFQSFFGAILVIGTNKIAKKFGYEGLW